MNWLNPNLTSQLRGSPDDLLNSFKGRDRDIATMFDGTTAFSNIPTNSKRLTGAGVLSNWNGSQWQSMTLGLSSGGTGASTSAGARSSLDVYSKGEVDSTRAAQATTITAGNGITGGGNLSANREIVLGTPSTVTVITTNSTTATSHTHALTIPAPDTITGSTTNNTSTTLHTHALAQTLDGVSGVYYNEADRSLNGDFTSGTAKITRVGRTVTVSTSSFSHVAQNVVSTKSSFVPAWAEPSTPQNNMVVIGEGLAAMLIATNGTITLQYKGFDGSPMDIDGGFGHTISYNI